MIVLAVPNKKQNQTGLLISLIIILIECIFFSLDYPVQGWFAGFYLTAVIFQLLVVFFNAVNPLFIFRLALLAVIAIGSAAASILGVYSANFGAEYQTILATRSLIFCSSIAASASCVGWFLIPGKANINPLGSHGKTTLYPLIISLFIFVLFLLFLRSGGIAGEDNAYASSAGKIKIPFGALNSVFHLMIAYILLINKGDNLRRNYLILGGISLAVVLTGSRADFLMQGLLLIAIGLNFFSVYNSFSKLLILILLAYVAWALSSYIGIWRNGGGFGELWLDTLKYTDVRSAGEVLVLSTANQMIGTFYAVYGKIYISGESYFLFGESYLDYIFRTLPQFFNTDRPLSLAYEMFVDGVQMAQGGIYEVSEAFWNFGYFGVFIIPAFISFLLRYSLERCRANQFKGSYYFWGSLFITASLMSPRAIWYQTFVYWRVFTVVLVFYAVFYLYNLIMKKKKFNA